jgi:hypothetical protein
MPGVAGMPGLNEILSHPQVLEAMQDPSYGGLLGCGPELSKCAKISEQPKGYESHQ